jgi:hypothetical protein
MVIHEHEGAESMGIGALNAFFDEFRSYNVADSLRTVRVALSGDEVVKLAEEILLHGDAEAVERFHTVLRFLEM